MSDSLLRVEHLTKKYDGKAVVKDVSLAVDKGELLCILGPSGCGKTTILRCIGGFTAPDAGTVYLEGKDVTKVPPESRDISTVFQSYGLFPHKTVEQNVGYGLKIRGLDKAERRAKVRHALEMVELVGYEHRYPAQLSGGQRQRVALARSLVLSPKLLLLDEPLSNLDAKLRGDLREKIRDLQKRLELAMIFVTHDQEEAFSLADRVLLMNEGEVVEKATPVELYARPRDPFTLAFIGNANRRGDKYLRYEDVGLIEGDDGTIVDIEFKGRFVEFTIETPEGERIKALELFDGTLDRAMGDKVGLVLPWKTIQSS